MRQIIQAFPLILLLIPGILIGQKTKGNGQVTTLTHDMSYFSGIELNGAYEVEVIQGEDHQVMITTDENLQDLIQVTVQEDVLVINTEDGLQDPEVLKLQITSTKFENMELNGAVSLYSNAPLVGKTLKVEVNGASSVNLALAYDEIASSISGAGSIEMAGNSEKIAFEVSGAGSIEALELEAKHVLVDISGTGSAKIHASESLIAGISGMGSVNYRGNPAIKKEVSGLGSIKPASSPE